MSSEFAIEAKGIRKEFKVLTSPVHQVLNIFNFCPPAVVRRKTVLDGLDFAIRRGEKVGILGVNGAGKSTLLSILAGMSQQTSGDLTINGEIGSILELGAGFHPELSGRQNAEFLLALSGQRKDTKRIMGDVITFSGLGSNIDEKVRTYSSGMLVRLAFAVAAMKKPDIFIVDEALAVGDAAFQRKCYEYLQETLEQATLILISHDISAISALCDRIIILDAGKIIFDGNPTLGIPIYNKIVHGDMVGVSQGDSLETRKSGPRAVDITAVTFEMNGNAINVVNPGDIVEVGIELLNTTKPMDVIVGVAATSSKGQRVFGQNTLGRQEIHCPLGSSKVSMQFEWPRVAPGRYFLTMGVSSFVAGIDSIQCWVNNAVEVQSILDERSHGLFNLEFKKIEISK